MKTIFVSETDLNGKAERSHRLRPAHQPDCHGDQLCARAGGRGTDALVRDRDGHADPRYGALHAGRGHVDEPHRQLHGLQADEIAQAAAHPDRELRPRRRHHSGGARFAGARGQRAGDRHNGVDLDRFGRRRLLPDAVHGAHSLFDLAAHDADRILRHRLCRGVFVG